MAVAALLGAALLAACGLDIVGIEVDGATADGGVDGASLADGDAPLDGAPGLDDASVDAPIEAAVDAAGIPRPIFVASEDAIWKLTPSDNLFVRVGTLDATCKSPFMEELAIDEGGQLFGTSSDSLNLYKVTLGSTVTCSIIQNGVQPYSLAFAPFNAARPESLVAFSGTGAYFRIDRLTGAQTLISDTGMQPYVPGGDIVSAGGSIGYVAAANHPSIVTSPPQAVCAHCLVEVDLTDGHFVKRLGDIGNGTIYGAAFSAGKIYAFANNNGMTYVITPSPFAVTTLPSPETNLHWFGATSSPVP